MDLCLFEAADPFRETARARLSRDESGLWGGFIAGVAPGFVARPMKEPTGAVVERSRCRWSDMERSRELRQPIGE